MKTPPPRAPGQASRAAGRPRQFDRQQALATAKDLFWRHGFEGVSVNMLSAALGIAAPSLYAAFGNKAALYRECLAAYLSEDGNFMLPLLASPLPARQAIEASLQAACRLYTARHQTRGCFVATAALQTGPEASAVAATLRALRLDARKQIAQRLERAVADGELGAEHDVTALATLYAALMQGLSVQALDGATLDDLLAVVALGMQAWPAPPRPPQR